MGEPAPADDEWRRSYRTRPQLVIFCVYGYRGFSLECKGLVEPGAKRKLSQGHKFGWKEYRKEKIQCHEESP